jgi:XTP/dITP diphosphohydrolase
MKKLVVATRNRGKLKEIEAFLSGLVENVLSAADLVGFKETIEDGASFQENALKKAREAMLFSGLPALADDSGLAVDILDGRPGIYSARFAGDGADDVANNSRLLSELGAVSDEQRQAAFVCAMAFVTPDGIEKVFTATLLGRILREARGDNGFGYDPLFLVDKFDHTMSELTIEEKNLISHRGQALKQFRSFLEESGLGYKP